MEETAEIAVAVQQPPPVVMEMEIQPPLAVNATPVAILEQPPPLQLQQQQQLPPPAEVPIDAEKEQQQQTPPIALAEIEGDEDVEMKTLGRGGFRGRPWNPGGGPMQRFRGRGFGPGGGMPPNMMRGRGGPPPFFRGGRGGPGGNRFGGPNFDPNWGPNNNNMAGPGFNGPAGGFGGSGPLELWVETKTEDGKSYFYHAITRETTWTRPEGPNVKVMTQSDVEAMNARNQQQQQQPPQNQQANHENSGKDQQQQVNNVQHMKTPPGGTKEGGGNETPENGANQMNNLPAAVSKPVEVPTSMPPPVQQQPPPFYPGAPPHFAGPPFGMPPPGYGGYPQAQPQASPWGMPWGVPNTPGQEPPAKNLIIKPGVIDPSVIGRAAEWSEHRAPDGRPYYYHAARGESVWEKPQAIRDLEAARMAAHSGVTPQSMAAQTSGTTTVSMGHSPIMTQAMNMSAMPPFDPLAQFATKPANEPPAAAAAKAAAAAVAAEDEAEKEKKKKEQEKKKKEEEEKSKQAATKVQDKSRPISSTPIAGTPWCVVWTGDGRVFFYNPSTRTSVWERPEDLLERADVDKAVSTPPEQLAGTLEKERKREQPVVELIIRNDPPPEVEAEETPSKKLKLSNNEPKPEKKVDVAKEAAIEAEVRAAKERALVPLETRVKSFKEMLKEKDVSAFSTWEKELHKIVFDPRYLLLTSRERKQVFEKYVKERAEEERKEKRNKMRAKRDDFRKLMEDAGLHGKSSFSDFCQRYGKEDRYKAIEKMRERESLFNEFIVEVRRREKDEKIHRKEQIKKNFIEMLRERSDIDRHSRWSDVRKKVESDSRYRSVDSSMLREDYFLEYCRIMKDEKRRAKDKERDRKDSKESKRNSDRKEKDRERDRDRDKDRDKEREKERDKERDKDRDKERDKDRDKEKDKDRDKDKEKDRDRSEKSNKQKEANNDEPGSSAGDRKDRKKSDEQEDGEHTTTDDEAERLQKERDRQLRAEQSIKEREKEVQRTLATHLRDRDKEREHHKRDEAIRHFSALLADLVRNPDLTWKEVRKQLRKDHRWELVENLERDDREKIFNEHIDSLMKKKRDKFREMLDEISALELTSPWKDIKKSVKEDPRYLKYNSSEKCEREFRDYIKDKTMEAKTSLRELLQECKLITYKSFETVNENPNHMKEIEEILKNDKRYLILEHMAPERTQIIMTYLEDLHKRGPPPPPTASESTRRK